MALQPAILHVVVDRVVVAGHRLERGEVGLGDSAARQVEHLADPKVRKCPRRHYVVGTRVELTVAPLIAPLP